MTMFEIEYDDSGAPVENFEFNSATEGTLAEPFIRLDLLNYLIHIIPNKQEYRGRNFRVFLNCKIFASQW